MSAPLPAPVTVRACAKVNLYLRITGLRPDGFHDLLTIFQAIDLADTLEFACEAGRDTLNLRCTAPGMPDIEHNLIGRAYHLLQSRYGDQIHHPGVICRVDKQIPLGAGLGGGSADAAGALAGLNALWNLGLDAATLRDLGAELGSDVPFINLGATAFGAGRGELLAPLPPIPVTPLVLIVPPVHVSTPEAFGWWDATGPSYDEIPRAGEVQGLWTNAILEGLWPQFMHSDFERVVCAQVPVIATIRDHLRVRGIHPILTGSGAALIAPVIDWPTATELIEHYIPIAGESIRLVRTLPTSGVTVTHG